MTTCRTVRPRTGLSTLNTKTTASGCSAAGHTAHMSTQAEVSTIQPLNIY